MSHPANRQPNHNDPTRGRKLRVERLEERAMLAGDLELVKDIAPLVGSSNPASFVEVGSVVYFTANDGATGVELWKSEGTSAGTVLVKDIRPGIEGSIPTSLVNVSGTLFFAANDGSSGTELWKSDGTAAGTVRVKDIVAGVDSGSPSSLVNVSGTLYFTALSSTAGIELWKSDGTEAGTVLVRNINSGANSSSPTGLTNVSGTLYFAAFDGSDTELWKSDGTSAGTSQVADIYAGSANSSHPHQLLNVGGVVYFAANDGVAGIELWSSDGTAVGTTRVKDLNVGSGNSSPRNLTNAGGFIYFVANDGVSGEELWKSDGVDGGTYRVKDLHVGSGSSSPSELVNLAGKIYFAATDGATGVEMWASDGTEVGTSLVKDIAGGANSGNPTLLTVALGELYFTANSGAGAELWQSDGTEAGTRVLRLPGNQALSTPAALAEVNERLFVSGTELALGQELYTLDLALVGDFNRNSVVDAADYTEWIANFGAAGVSIAGDANRDGVVDAADYTLWRDQRGHFYDDHGDHPASATPLGSPGFSLGIISTATDTDWFRFTASSSREQTVAVALQSLSGTTLRVYRADGVTLLGSDLDGGAGEVTFTPVVGEQYFVQVATATDDVGDYELSIRSDDHYGTFTLATSLQFGSSRAGWINHAVDADWLSFTGTIRLEHTARVQLGLLSGAKLRLFDSDGSTALSEDVDGGAGVIVFTPTSTGPFFLEVTGDQGAVGNYTVVVTRDDHGDTPALATAVAFPSTTTFGSIGKATDVDWFRFTPTVGVLNRISASYFSSSTNLQVRVYDADATTLLGSDLDGVDGVVLITPTTSGPYYIQISGLNGATPFYQLSLRIDDHGDSANTATSILTPSNTSFVLSDAADKDWFRFDVPTAGIEYTIGIGQFGSNTSIKVYEANGVTLVAASQFSSTSLRFTPTTAGIHYIQLATDFFTFSSSTTLTLSKDDGNSAALATLLTLPTSHAGTLPFASDSDWFRFEATAGTLYRVGANWANSTTSGPPIRVYDSTSTNLIVSNVNGSASLLNFRALATGPYYIKLSDAGSSVGYLLNVSPDDYGDLPTSAEPIASPTSIVGAIEFAPDKDFFRLTPKAGVTHRFTLTPGTLAGGTLRLLSNSGQVLASDTNGGAAEISYIPTSTAPLLIEVAGFSSAMGTYSLTLENDDHGDNYSYATSLANPGVETGVIGNLTDSDWFRFTAVAGQELTVVATTGTISGLKLKLLDGGGATVATDSDGGNGQVRFTPQYAGTYYAIVEGHSGATGSFTLSVAGDDHGNSTSSATAASLPGSITGEITSATDTDWFRFTANYGFNVTLKVGLGTIPGVSVTLLNSSGTPVTSDTNGGEGYLSFTAAGAGTYYVAISGYSGAAGSYSLNLVSDDHGDLLGYATTISTTHASTGTINSEADSDWFLIDGSPYNTLHVNVTPGTLSDIFVSIRNSSGVVLASDFDGGSGVLSYGTGSFGYYYIVVTSAGAVGASGTYSLLVDEHLATPATATHVSPPSTKAGLIATANDVDGFRFSLSAGVRYQLFAALGTLSGAELRLFDSSGAMLLASDLNGGEGILNFTSATSGAFYCEVVGHNGATGSYTLQVAGEDFGDTPATGASVGLPATLPGLIASPLDSDWFVFNPTPNFIYQVIVTTGSLSGSNLRIYGSAGATLLASDLDGGPAVIDFTPTAVGPYYVEVTGFNGATGTYTLGITKEDHGNAPTVATLLNADSIPKSGVLNTITDVDWFRFNATAFFEYRVTLSPTSLSGGVLRVYDATGVTIVAADLDGAAAQIKFTPTSDGPYYAEVTGFESAAGTYSLTVSKEDHGNLPSVATTLNVPSQRTGVINSSSDSDWFRFVHDAASPTYLTIHPSSLSDVNVELLGADGTTLLASDTNGGQANLALVANVSGYYFAKVTGSSGAEGSYRLALSKDAHANSAAGATTITIPSDWFSSIDSPTDTDWFSLVVSGVSPISLLVEAYFLQDARLRIYSANGVTLLASDEDGGEADLTFTPPVPGTYHFEIAGQGGAFGNYSFSLRAAPASAARIAIETTAVAQRVATFDSRSSAQLAPSRPRARQFECQALRVASDPLTKQSDLLPVNAHDRATTRAHEEVFAALTERLPIFPARRLRSLG